MAEDTEDGGAPAKAPVVALEMADQFGALCLRQSDAGGVEVLLITTRETKRWTIPKGWPIRGLKPHRVAEREAWEEAGIEGRAKKRVFGNFSYMKKLPDGDLLLLIVEVHVLDAKRCRRRFPERGERAIAWFSPGEAARLVAEPELQRLLRKLDARL